MTKRVLITGAGGFAGTYAASEFAGAGYDVAGLVNSEGHDAAGGLKAVYSADLRDFESLQKIIVDIRPTHVVHLAAISFVGHGNISEIYETNVVGTRNLLRCLSGLGEKPEAVLLTSSANVYGNSDKGVLAEDDAINPANDYAVSKIAMEYVARQFSDSLKMTIARPFNYTGRGQSENFLVPKIVNHFRAGKTFIELGNIDVSRDFSDVRSVVQYFRMLVESPKTIGNVYNICTGIPYSLQYILETCQEITGHALEVRVNPAFVRANEIKSLVGSPTKLYGDVGQVESFSMRQTLEWMLAP